MSRSEWLRDLVAGKKETIRCFECDYFLPSTRFAGFCIEETKIKAVGIYWSCASSKEKNEAEY